MSTSPDNQVLGTTALRAVATIRLANGTLVCSPRVPARHTGSDSHAWSYAFHMFGLRTVVLGGDLLLLTGEAQARTRDEAISSTRPTPRALSGVVYGTADRRASSARPWRSRPSTRGSPLWGASKLPRPEVSYVANLSGIAGPGQGMRVRKTASSGSRAFMNGSPARPTTIE